MHPNPQFRREQWVDLRGAWGFTYDDENKGLEDGWQEREDVYTRTIQVPFPPESAASGIADNTFHPIVWYRRLFSTPENSAEKRFLLYCGAIDYSAQVWVNGHFVAAHEGGNTPFSVDITNALQYGTQQVVVIRAEDMPKDVEQPRGKQDWHEQPHAIWYHRTTGIWQPVWLEVVSPTYMRAVQWTSDAAAMQVQMHVQVQRRTQAPLQLRVELRLHDSVVSDDIYSVQDKEVERSIRLVPSLGFDDRRMLWTPEHPNLIEATLTLMQGQEILDEVHSYLGLRNVEIRNRRFLLNGEPYYLRLVLEQGYWPTSHLAAPSDEALRREVELVKELGFNGVRIHQKVEDPRFLYWCDRLGVLVWGEMANAYAFSRRAVELLTREWIDVVKRDYNHPCIVTWVPLNESWGVPNLEGDSQQQHYVQLLYHLTKTLDSTRPVIGNDGWEHVVGDIYSIHDYTFSGETMRARYSTYEALKETLDQVQPAHRTLVLAKEGYTKQPVMITEYGGISYRPTSGTAWHGYGTVTTEEEFLKKYGDLTHAILDSSVLVGFCYTQLTDTEQETNGLLTVDRQPKLPLAAIHNITNRPSSAIPGDIVIQIQREQKHEGL